MKVTSLNALEIGKTYEAIIGDDGQPALQVVVTRGRPRRLSNEQIIAARALRAMGMSYSQIGEIVDASEGAVRTALGAR